ncbi:MAG TPA: amidohydrolase family protein [Candidatus Entotheonella sp.]|jgi:predicted TIM-barrel fold metal-dependent hydrolase
MAKPYEFISSDTHLEVLPERWTGRVDAKYRDQMPRTVPHPDGGDALYIEGTPLFQVAYLDLRAGRTSENWQPFDVKVEDTAGVGSPEQRLHEQDQDGCAAEVLFPNMQAGPGLWRNIADDNAYLAAIRAYNDWLAEEYCAVDPRRLVGLGVMPMTTLADSLAELEHCAKLGLRGVVLSAFPNGMAYPLPEDDQFWSAAMAMHMPLTVHVAFDRGGPRAEQPTFIYPDENPDILRKVKRGLVDQMALLGLRPATSFSQLIASGVFDRLPDLRIFFAETRLGWVPFWMNEADFWYERHRHWAQRYLGFKPLQRKPSEYMQEHFLFSVQGPELVAIELRHHLGVEHIMFATDFPHIECEWPNTKPTLDCLMAGVSPDEKYKIVAGNVIDYFGLDPVVFN